MVRFLSQSRSLPQQDSAAHIAAGAVRLKTHVQNSAPWGAHNLELSVGYETIPA